MSRLAVLGCLSVALGFACGPLAAHDLGLKAGSIMVCTGGEEPVLAKLHEVDASRAEPGNGPLIHTTLFTADGQTVAHAAIFSHYFMNCRITSPGAPIPDGFQAALKAWREAGGAPVFRVEPAAVFASEANKSRP